MKVLTIDVGNTSTTLGLYADGAIQQHRRLERKVQNEERVAELLTALVAGDPPQGAVVASVVPDMSSLWTGKVLELFGLTALEVTHQIKLGVAVNYPEPESIGPDRLANAAAAARLYGTPVVVADFGTALTFDIVSREDGYVGGIIAPGLPLMFDYLYERTALLPRVRPEPIEGCIGRSTEEAMRIGAQLGYRGMVREMVQALRVELGDELKVCGTGGFASWVLKDYDLSITIEPDLTLLGLGYIYELNR